MGATKGEGGGWRRIPIPVLMTLTDPGTWGYQKDLEDGHLTVFVSPDRGVGLHMSISHRTDDLQPGRYPSWDEIVEARYRFLPNHLTMAMLLPPEEEYVNAHPTTFHLWSLPEEQSHATGEEEASTT